MIRSELRARLWTLLGEDPNGPRNWTAEELNRHLNDAYKDVARETRALEIRVAVATTADQGTYTVPPWCGRIFRVAWDDYALIPDTSLAMDWTDEDWVDLSGTPSRWIKDRLEERQFRIWPAPESVSNGFTFDSELGTVIQVSGDSEVEFNSELGCMVRIESTDGEEQFDGELGVIVASFDGDIEVWATEIPLPLDEDSDEPKIPEHYQMAIVFRAGQIALRSHRETRNDELSAAYGAIAREYYAEIESRANDRQPSRVRVNGRPANFRPRSLRRETHITTS